MRGIREIRCVVLRVRALRAARSFRDFWAMIYVVVVGFFFFLVLAFSD